MENIRKTTGGQSGFTIVEVLIAMLILAIGLLSVATSFAQGMLILANTPMQLAAKELAYEIVDEIAIQYDAGSLVLVAGRYELAGELKREGRSFDNAWGDVIDTGAGLQVTATVEYKINGKARSYTTPLVTIEPL